jgi:hypothetical protein
MHTDSFTFGIYPGSQLGTTSGMAGGSPDLPERIQAALDDLQGEHFALLVRCYIVYRGKEGAPVFSVAQPHQYAIRGRQLDLVLCFQSLEEDLQGWQEFITRTLEEYHPYLGKIQITEEANVDLPVLDGHFPNSRKALVEGIVLAGKILQDMGLNIPVGFNATPDFNPNKKFWKEIAALAGPSFYQALGYVGLDFFPDVFRPIPNSDQEGVLEEVIKNIVAYYRNTDLAQAGISPEIPLHITENGWPTSEGRSEAKQADRIETIVRVLYKFREEFKITHYELFGLRDADSRQADIFYHFGIMKDNYQPKTAFLRFKKLISELGTRTEIG